MYAIENKNNIELLNFLIAKGADINAVDKDGKNILIYAFYIKPYPSLELIENLLKWGADVNTSDKHRLVPLMHVFINRLDISYIKLLIKYGANINADDGYGTVLSTYANLYYNDKPNHKKIVNLLTKSELQETPKPVARPRNTLPTTSKYYLKKSTTTNSNSKIPTKFNLSSGGSKNKRTFKPNRKLYKTHKT